MSNPTSRTGSCGLGSSQFWVMRFGPVSSTIGLMLWFGGVLVCLGSHLSVLRLIQSHGAQSALPLWNRTGRQHFVRGMPDLCVLSHPLAGRIRRCPQLRQTLRNSTVIFQKCAGWPSSTSTCVTIGSCLSPQHTHTTWTGSAHWDPSPDWFTQLQKNSCHRMLSAGCKEAAIGHDLGIFVHRFQRIVGKDCPVHRSAITCFTFWTCILETKKPFAARLSGFYPQRCFWKVSYKAFAWMRMRSWSCGKSTAETLPARAHGCTTTSRDGSIGALALRTRRKWRYCCPSYGLWVDTLRIALNGGYLVRRSSSPVQWISPAQIAQATW